MLFDNTTFELNYGCELNISKYDDKDLLKLCVKDIKTKIEFRPHIQICGKTVRQSRNVGFFSDETYGFNYSGSIMKAQPVTNNLKKLMDSINDKFDANFNGILINEYVDGTNGIGAHSDNMQFLDPNAGVVTVSYGGSRDFIVRDKSTKKAVAKVCASSCSIIHMKGENFQKKFTHEIPKTTIPTKTRYSFTFRCHN